MDVTLYMTVHDGVNCSIKNYLYMLHFLGRSLVVGNQENSHTFQCHYHQKKNSFQKNCMDKELVFQLYHLKKHAY